MTLYDYDREQQISCLCGVDEAGRGPLAGPVVAAAVILPLDEEIEGINDSKKLTEKKREALCEQIKQKAIAYSIGSASVEEIDTYNILQATFLAMKRAVEGLNRKPDFVLIDGNKNPDVGIPSRFVVKGDATSANIAAASILAKVTRDHYMMELDQQYPEYQLAKHKGYGTKLHHQMILEYGMAPIHRRSFLVKLRAKEPSISLYRGEYGEKIAYGYLKKNGYTVLAKNYHSPYGEIDLIAQKDGILSFIEVKLRDVSCLYEAEESITKTKQKKIIQTAEYILQQHSTQLQPRFDIIGITLLGEQQVNIRFLSNAFVLEES